MMKGYIKNNQPEKAIDLFNEIINPNQVIINLLFSACAHIGTDQTLNLLKKVSSNIPISFYKNPYILTSLVNALIECDDIKHAQILFEKSTVKTLPLYATMMKGYVINDMASKAIDLFNKIDNDQPNIENNNEKKSNLFPILKTDINEENIGIYICLIKALSQIGILPICQLMVKRIPTFILNYHRIQNALIDMWGKAGCVNEAKRIFEIMSQPDQIGYTAMINCYGLNGMGIQAVELFRKMPKKFINDLTYVCVLNACSHSGLVNIARSIFNDIQNKTEIIFTTYIDCLSRAAAFEESFQLIIEFERNNPPAAPLYMALLSGARNAKNINLSQKVFDRMKNLFADLKHSMISASILLANVYASSGDIEQASNIRIQLHKSGAKKKVGLSLTEIDGIIMQFRAHDQSHPRSSEIYAEGERISKELIEHGHGYDASWIVRPMENDETIESIFCGHSERLAIAANFIDNRKPSRIHITKNLRVCGDCHRATKLIAAIRQCEIIVRDANRIHHFSPNGQCSCQDYF
ncbi:unnamed protein product [Rotaria sp. Silwood1]|nr:unnamed protein product [Rotaria sp. Silwood1]